MARRRFVAWGTFAVPAAVYLLLARHRQLRWGATGQEYAGPVAGDGLTPKADSGATRAITIRVPADQAGPRIARLGQERGGSYSYDFLENLVGYDIHSAARIVPGWKHIALGDQVRLATQAGLAVVHVEAGRSLVLRGAVPVRNTALPHDLTWAFALRDESGETTRLLVLERYGYTRSWARLLVEPAEAISFLMSREMLRAVEERAESTVTRPGGA